MPAQLGRYLKLRALLLPILLPFACARAEAPPPPTSHILEGTFIDQYSGAPLPEIPIRLKGDYVSFDAKTDASGRFRFDQLREGSYTIEWLEDGVYRYASSTAVPANEGLQVPLRLRPWVETTFGPVCDKPRAVATPLAVPFVVFLKGDSWEVDTLELNFTGPWNRAWNGLICIEQDFEDAGEYVDEFGQSTSRKGHRVMWNVRVVRLQDGKVFRTKLSSDPPQSSSSSSDEYGDPGPLFQAWLEEKVPK